MSEPVATTRGKRDVEANGSSAAVAPEDGSAGTEGGDAYPLPEDELFYVLQNERRRAVLRYMEDRDGTVEMRDVAEQVAAWEHDTTVAQLSSDERQRVYISLYQSHLDTLDDAGVVEYEKSRGDVELTDVGVDVAAYMNGGDDGGFDWTDDSVHYLAATAVGSILVGGSSTGFLGLVRISPYVASVLTVAMFTAVALSRILPKLP